MQLVTAKKCRNNNTMPSLLFPITNSLTVLHKFFLRKKDIQHVKFRNTVLYKQISSDNKINLPEKFKMLSVHNVWDF